jgi:hypothetical protein
MNNNEQQTFQTDHPTIKEITIGDRFITHNDEIVEFASYDGSIVPFLFENISYTKGRFKLAWVYKNLRYDMIHFNIKDRYIPLKDKVNQL